MVWPSYQQDMNILLANIGSNQYLAISFTLIEISNPMLVIMQSLEVHYYFFEAN